MSLLSAACSRGDKLLSEADNRPLCDAWRERRGIAKLYCGPLALAKVIPSLVGQDLLSATCKPGIVRLASSSQQIVVFAAEQPDMVMKIDRHSLTMRRNTQPERRETIIRLMAAATGIVGVEYVPTSTVEITDNPLAYGPDTVVGIMQQRVFNPRDVFGLSEDELEGLSDDTKASLSIIGQRIQRAITDKSLLLPDLNGRGNLVLGDVEGVENVWLIDNLPTNTYTPALQSVNNKYAHHLATLVAAR